MKLSTQYMTQNIGVLLAKVQQVLVVRHDNSALAAPPDWEKTNKF